MYSEIFNSCRWGNNKLYDQTLPNYLFASSVNPGSELIGDDELTGWVL